MSARKKDRTKKKKDSTTYLEQMMKQILMTTFLLLGLYITEFEKSKSVKSILGDMKSTKSLTSQIWSYGSQMLNSREIGALGASDTLLGILLSGSDKNMTIRWLNIRQIRNCKLEMYDEIKKMDENSTEIFAPNLIDSYYPNRPKVLKDLCLYEFCEVWDIRQTNPSGNLLRIALSLNRIRSG